MGELINPHDKLFKEIEKVKENCRDLIESTFPTELLEKLDLDTLENDNNSYIDETLKEYYSDIVYNCEYNNDTTIKISILFEHKSYVPDNEYLQLLRYILSIWEYAVKNKEELPIVIPVIFYHGKKKWKVKPLFKYFDGVDEILRQFIPDFKYILTDLIKIPDSVIINEKFNSNINKVMALLFKHMNDEKYIEVHLEDIFSLVKEFFPDEKSGVIITFIVYIMSITEIDNEYIGKCLNRISPEGGEIAMTTAMKLRQEGIEQGIEKGEKKGAYEKAVKTAAVLKKAKVSIDLIIESTGLSREDIDKL